MALVAVCAAPDLAAALVAGGIHVVLCGTDGPNMATTVVSLRRTATRGIPTAAPTAAPPSPDVPPSPELPTEATAGRIAVLVGDLDQPEVEAAALAMARELFGAEPVAVRTESEARQLLTSADRLEQARSGTFELPFDSWSNPTP